MTQIRLNKFLAQTGFASLRKIDTLISNQKITVNGVFATLGQKIDPQKDKIFFENKPLNVSKDKLVYFILNKPLNVLSTTSDDRGRKTVLDFVKTPHRLFPVGRLDYNSTGLILLTNDGSLALKITHPRYHLPKVYLVTILGKISPPKISSLCSNLVKVKFVKFSENKSLLKFTLFQGKKRQIRLLCQDAHLHLLTLHRISIGPLNLGGLKPGEYRPLSTAEVKDLYSTFT